MKRPKKVERCTTHHHACDCHQWRYEQMETALKIISIWAGEYEERRSSSTTTDIFSLIKAEAREALDCLK